jgi:hypothetical protein
MKQPSRPRPDQIEYMRPGILPGLLGALAVLSGLFLYSTDWFITIEFAVSILSAIMVAFSLQGRLVRPVITYVFVPLLIAIVVIWNPIVNFSTTVATALTPQGWMLTEVAAAVIVFLAGVLTKTIAPKR